MAERSPEQQIREALTLAPQDLVQDAAPYAQALAALERLVAERDEAHGRLKKVSALLRDAQAEAAHGQTASPRHIDNCVTAALAAAAGRTPAEGEDEPTAQSEMARRGELPPPTIFAPLEAGRTPGEEAP